MKRLRNIALITLAVLVLLPSSSYLALRSPAVQTWLTQYLAGRLSVQLGADVSVEGVDIDFSRRIIAENLLVNDLRGDTLLWAGRLRLDIASFSYGKRRLAIRKASLSPAVLHLKRYRGEEDVNLQFILDALASEDTVAQSPWDVTVAALELQELDFLWRDENIPDTMRGVDYNHIHCRNTSLKISAPSFTGDTVTGHIRHLSFTERSGFVLERLSGKARVSPSGLSVEKLEVVTPGTRLRADLAFSHKDYGAWNDFIRKVKMDVRFGRSAVRAADIAFFAPGLEGVDVSVQLAGHVSGTVSRLKGKDVSLYFGGASRFAGDFSVRGLPDMDQAFMHVKVASFQTTRADLEALPVPPFAEGGRLDPGDRIGLLGKMTFEGDFTGFYNDFVAYGNFGTALGKVSTDLSFTAGERISYRGRMRSHGFDAGRLLSVPGLGRISMKAEVNGSGLDERRLETDISAAIGEVTYRGYTYRDVDVSGFLASNLFRGSVRVKDDNIDLAFDGAIDYSGARPAFDFTAAVGTAKLHRLNLADSAGRLDIRTEAVIQLTGGRPDDLRGNISLVRTVFTRDSLVFPVDRMDIAITEDEGRKLIRMRSGAADASLKGEIALEELANAVFRTLNGYLPSYKAYTRNMKFREQDFEYWIDVKDAAVANRIFFPKVLVAPGTKITGLFRSAGNALRFDMTSPRVEAAGMAAQDVTVSVKTESDYIAATAEAGAVRLRDDRYLRRLTLDAGVLHDSIRYRLRWDNGDTVAYLGDVAGIASFSRYPVIVNDLLPSSVTVSDTVWTIAGGRLLADTGSVTVRDFTVRTPGQSLQAAGVVSSDKYDKLDITLTSFNLQTTDVLLGGKGLSLRGTVDGRVSLSNLLASPAGTANVNFRGLYVNGQDLGDGLVASDWNNRYNFAKVRGTFSRGGLPSVDFDGYYYPYNSEETFDLNISVTRIRLSLFDRYVNSFVSDLKGIVTGRLSLKGSPAKPRLNGELQFQKTVFTVNYLNMRYSFAGPIRFADKWMEFDNLVISDAVHGTKAVTEGRLFHEGFRKWSFDISLEMDNFHCLNTTDRHSKLYYGQAYASGPVNVRGEPGNVVIDAIVRTEKGTRISIPLDSPEEVGQSGFVTFINRADTVPAAAAAPADLSGIRMNMDLVITPDAEVQVIFDEKVGDIMKGRGDASLKMEISTAGNFAMAGEYTIDQGEYLFTLQNVINKRFRVEKGGTITWAGNPYEADVDLHAVYSLRTPLSDLFQDTTQAYKKRVPVDCDMFLTGKLLQPGIRFGVSLPNSPEDIRSQVSSVINTEQEVNRQVFSLLVLYRFTPPAQLSSGGGPQHGAFESGAGTTSELLSNQLSNWISQISDKYDIGVNYRPGDKLTDEELEVALSTQLFNDRVSVESNVGYAGSENTSASRVVGDFNVEYKISEDGKLRVKAFNRSNDFDLISTDAPYTQGVGLFYRQEFDSWRGLMKKVFGRKEEGE